MGASTPFTISTQKPCCVHLHLGGSPFERGRLLQPITSLGRDPWLGYTEGVEVLAPYLEEAVRRLREALDLEAVYLFGSHARGTADARSDLDLLVVARTHLPPLKRIGLVLELLQDAPWPVEALVLTLEEWVERQELPFLRGILREAVPLYERGKEAA